MLRQLQSAVKETLNPFIVLSIGLTLSAPVFAQDNAPVQVRTQDLSTLSIAVRSTAPATVVSANRSVIASEVAAVIGSVEVDVADVVQQGQLLIQLDPVDFELAVKRARAVLRATDARITQAEQRLKRAQELKQRDYASADDLLTRETDVAVLKADWQGQLVALEQAQRELSKTRITAPFDGVIAQRQGQAGAFVGLGTPLLTLVDHQQVELEADLNPADVASLRTAREIRFTVDGQQWPLTLARISPVVETAGRVVKARLTFDAQQPLTGASGDLTWVKTELMIPASLLLKRSGELGLFVTRNQRAEFYPLPNAQEGRPARIALPGDTQVIVSGGDRLQGGEQVVSTQ